MPKLTKRLIDSLVVEKTSYFIWDSEVIGFGIRVMPSGVRTYQVQYRKGRRTRRSSIGRHGVVTLDQARRTAKAMLGLVASGQDPIEEIARERMAPTVNELCDRFLEMHVADRCKPSTARDYKSVIRRFVKPIIGTYRVAEVERKDIADLHYKLKATPIQANRTLSVLSKMFNMAEIWGLRDDGSNPCRHVPKYRENRKERFLSTDELSKIGHVLSTALTDGSETPYVVAAFRLLLLTGCRLSEIQKMKWEYTTERGLELPETKTGKRCIPLPHSAREVLSDIPRTMGNPFVIEGKLPDSHITDLQHPWRRLRKKAGLNDVRIHDLRHTYASIAVSGGMPIQMVGKLLGHTQLQTTLRYAHLADDPIRSAAEENSFAISSALGGHQSPNTYLRVVK